MRPASGGHPTPFLSGPPLHAGFTPRTGAARAVAPVEAGAEAGVEAVVSCGLVGAGFPRLLASFSGTGHDRAC